MSLPVSRIFFRFMKRINMYKTQEDTKRNLTIYKREKSQAKKQKRTKSKKWKKRVSLRNKLSCRSLNTPIRLVRCCSSSSQPSFIHSYICVKIGIPTLQTCLLTLSYSMLKKQRKISTKPLGASSAYTQIRTKFISKKQRVVEYQIRSIEWSIITMIL